MKSNLAILSSDQKSIDFIKKNKLSSTLNLYANSSRNIEVAQIFAETHNFKKYYGAYEDLIRDKGVDFVLNFLPSGIKFEYIYLCLKNNIKLIYSATSANLGNKGNDKNLSPYAFTKAKNLELLENLKKWFNFKYEVIYFYNVYGPNQICEGKMATVIGIFENCFKKNKPLPVVKPGSQTRRFTHINL